MTDAQPSGDISALDGPSLDCDLLVVGSGAAGLSAGLTACKAGLSVLIVEKAPVFGGTSALSGGGVWVPDNPLSRGAGQRDGADNALAYLRSLCGPGLDLPVARAYLARCNEAIGFLTDNSGLRFGPNPLPDYRAELPGGVAGGRSLRAGRFDGRRLGPLLRDLRPPLAATTIFGGMMISAEDLPDLFRAGRAPRSALRVAGMLWRHIRDLVRNGRVTRLANGNALVAALAAAYAAAGGRIWLETPLAQLTHDGTRVTGATVRHGGRAVQIRARRGVVLASGGVPHGAFADTLWAGVPHLSLAPAENAGDGMGAATAIGAAFRADLAEAAALAPVSRVPVGAATCGFPHFFDRAKPGFIAVSQQGHRFANESDEYHVFCRALINTARTEGRIFLICDHRALRRYGLGPVPPFPGRLGPWLRNGYLRRGRDLADLAQRIGCDAGTLAATVARYNAGAAQGRDPEFGRGSTIYNRFIGDAEAPSPNNAPLLRAPFYAVEIMAGDLGSFAGLRCNAAAQVLAPAGQAIAGLYAAGNDVASFMAGHYPAAGITLGPALTFGYLAARHAAGLEAQAVRSSAA